MNKPSFLPSRKGIERNKYDLLALFFLAGWPFVFFWQAALRLAVFSFGDILLFFFPTHLAYANALRAGRLPLWEPTMMAGFPLFAEGQIGALYPLHPLLYGLLPVDLATNYDILFHLAWVGVGTYLFARIIGLSRPAALLTAFTFGAGGFFYARLQHMSVLATASWLPWLLWVWEKHEREPVAHRRWRWLALFALFSGIQLLGGHPQFAFSSALIIVMYSLVRWPRSKGLAEESNRVERRLPRILRFLLEYFDPLRLVPLGFAYLVGIALAAVQLVPTFELAGLTSRAGGLDARFFNAFSLRPVHFLMLFDPFVLGNPMPLVSVEVIGYIGLLALLLAIGAILVRRDRRVVFFVFISLLALFLGVGDQNIVYRAMRYLPLFNYFRVPSRFLYWHSFAAAVLAGITFDYLLSRASEAPRLTRRVRALLLLMTLLAATIVGLVPVTPVDFWLSLWVWLPLVFSVVSITVIVGARRRLFSRTALAVVVLGVAVLDLALFATVYAKTYDSTTSVADFYRPPDSLSALKDISPGNGRVLTSLWAYPWQSAMRESLYPNTYMIYGIASGIGYTPLILERVSEYLEQITPQMANLLNVRYYLLPQLLPVDPKTEGDDVNNMFNLSPVNREVDIPPTPATRLRVISSSAQSTAWQRGQVIAQIYLSTETGAMLQLPLRAGIDTAEWAFERSDVRKVLPYPMPTVATTFPARSAFPTESHNGHTYLAEMSLTSGGPPPTITGIYVYPEVPEGLIHIDEMALVTPEGQSVSVAHLVGRDDQVLVYRSNQVAVFENPDALPRAFLVHSAHVADDQTAENEMFRSDFDPRANLILDQGQALKQGGAQQPGELVRISEYQPEHVSISVRASSDAYLLLADTWYPGWNARLDDKEVPIARGDLIFRAVRVPPGDHTIEFDYRPLSLYLGAAASLMGWLVLIGILAASRRASRVVI